jgi:N-methylhydantoinase A
MSVRIGIDGGTFTDAAFAYEDELRILKTPSTTSQPQVGVNEALRLGGVRPQDAARFVHGTTIITNLLIERNGRRVALVTTAGFEDLLEIQHGDKPNTYDLTWRKPEPFVARPHRFGVRERIAFDGEVLVPLASEEVARAVTSVRDSGAAAIAVCLLNAHVNPAHERLLAEALAEALPDLHRSLSSEVDPAVREYERLSTTVLNAYSMPAVSGYIADEASKWGDVQFMSSSGGAVESDVAARLPIGLAFSGPAGGVVGAAAVGKAGGYGDLITFDMGGTSTDVAIVRDGRPDVRAEGEVDWSIPYRFPCLDINSVGAGGGSMVWFDDGGALRVGPRSAGASPGPACYGRGGEEATVTDVNVLLGLVPGRTFGGGAVEIDRGAASAALERLAATAGGERDELAFGAWRIVNANMAHAIRQITVYRGIDPRGMSLLCFGSAGGQHAVEVARELHIGRVVVPAAAPVFSAVGMLAARVEVYGSCPVDGLVESLFADPAVGLRVSGLEQELAADRDAADALERLWTLECRHVGQTRSLTIDFYPTSDTPATVTRRFLAEHERLYGMRGETDVEVINARLCLASADPDHRAWRPGAGGGPDELDGGGGADVAMEDRAVEVLRRSELADGDAGDGPALVADATSTVYVPTGARWAMDAFGSLLVDVDG